MNGADYIAVVRLSNRENETLAAVGATCERVPEESLDWLLRDGLIRHEPRTAHEKPAARGRRPRADQEGE